MFETTLENGIYDIDIVVTDYDHEPYERASWNSPGQSEYVIINKVMLLDENGKEVCEICLLPDAAVEVAEIVLSDLSDERVYNKYGYMLN